MTPKTYQMIFKYSSELGRDYCNGDNITVFSGHDAVKFGREVLPKCCNISMTALQSQNTIQMRLNFVRQANVICMKEFLDEYRKIWFQLRIQ
jgi:hypothetical protein